MKGHFITFEGIDGCGKSTQLQLAADWLDSMGMKTCKTFEPGDGELGAEIRRVLLSAEHVPVPEAELLLFLADRVQHVRTMIQPALNRDEWVLCDRYTDSTLAYQLAGRRLDAVDLGGLLSFAELGVRPRLTLWVDLPVTEALKRMHKRSRQGQESTRIDKEAAAFHERVCEGFEQIWLQQPERICRIDGNGSIEQVQQRIRQIMQERLEIQQ